MNAKITFTKKDVAVVFICVFVLVMTLGAVGKKGRSHAKFIVCQSNLQKWGQVFWLFAQDNEDSFPQNIAGDGLTNYEAYWCHATIEYYEDPRLRFCPACERNMDRVREIEAGAPPAMTYGKTFMNWGPFDEPDTVTPNNWWDEYPESSYGMNGWCANPPEGISDLWGADPTLTWRKFSNVTSPGIVPLFLDNKLVDTYPMEYSPPPELADGDCNFLDYIVEPMKLVCMDRHKGGINSVFVDLSVKKSRLKKLWEKKWHKEYNIAGPWTTEGGVTEEDLPEWMQDMQDY